MKTGLLISFYFVAMVSFGQSFFDSLTAEADKSYTSSFVTIDVDSLQNDFVASKNIHQQIDSTAHYQVLFSHSNSFSYQGGMGHPCPCTYDEYVAAQKIQHLLDSNYQRTPNTKRHFLASKTYSGYDLLEFPVTKPDTVLTSFPIIRNNRDAYNNQWTVFCNGPLLIFKYVSLYHGNRYSYHETLIYLQKVE